MPTIGGSITAVQTKPGDVQGPHLVGLWHKAGITAWAAMWMVSLMAFILAIGAWYWWDSVKTAQIAHYFPDFDQASQAFNYQYKAEINRLGMSLPFYAGLFAVVRLISGIPFFILSALIVFRRSDRLMAIFFAIVLAVVGAAGRVFNPNWGVLPGFFPWSRPLVILLEFIIENVIVLAYTLPDGRFVPRWTRWLVIPLLVLSLSQTFLASTPLGHLPGSLPFFLSRIFILVGVFSLTYRYLRDASTVQKQQIKWIVVGGFLIEIFDLAHFIVYDTPLLDPWIAGTARDTLIIELILEPGWYIAQSILALFIGISLFRYRLWDIDLIIRRTLQYSLLTGLLSLLYFGIVTLLQAVLTALGGQPSTVVIVLTTLFIAALFNPLRWRIQAFIDRRFYRQKYDSEQALSEFAEVARSETDLEQLSGRLIRTILETLQPEQVSLWITSPPGNTDFYINDPLNSERKV